MTQNQFSLPRATWMRMRRIKQQFSISDLELGRLGAWVVKNSSWLALGITLVAFAMRLFYCDCCYLNPHEAAHFEAARPSSWLETYKASFRLAHPPLFILGSSGNRVGDFGALEAVFTR